MTCFLSFTSKYVYISGISPVFFCLPFLSLSLPNILCCNKTHAHYLLSIRIQAAVSSILVEFLKGFTFPFSVSAAETLPLSPEDYQQPLQAMSRDEYFFVPAPPSISVAAALATKLNASQYSKFCRLKNCGSVCIRQPMNVAMVTPASSAHINADFMQLMRVKMIKAFIHSETTKESLQDLPLAPPPSLDRVLLRRANLNSRKLHLLSGQAPAVARDSVHVCHDPILVTHPFISILLPN